MQHRMLLHDVPVSPLAHREGLLNPEAEKEVMFDTLPVSLFHINSSRSSSVRWTVKYYLN